MPRFEIESEQSELVPLLTISELSRKLGVDRVAVTAIINDHRIAPAGSADGTLVFFAGAIEQVRSAIKGGAQ